MIARRLGVLALWLTTLAFAPACGTNAVGVDACRQIQEARCRQAPACGISLQPPYSTSGSDVDACIRFVDDTCLHGTQATPPPPTAVSDCVNAIQKHGCGVVKAPESDMACAWLIPPPSAATPDASDATSEAGDATAE